MQLSDLKKWTTDLLTGALKLVPMKRNASKGKEETGDEVVDNDSKGYEETRDKEDTSENRSDKLSTNIDPTMNGKERSEL